MNLIPNDEWDVDAIRADHWCRHRANSYLIGVNGRSHKRKPCGEDVDDVAALWWKHAGGVHDFLLWADSVCIDPKRHMTFLKARAAA